LSAVLPAVAGVIALTTATAAASVPAGGPTPAQVGCEYEYAVWDFGFGFTAGLEVTNTGSDPANGWWVEFDLPDGVTIETTYGGRFTGRSGHIRVTAPDWLPNLAPGRYTNLGFSGRKTAGIDPAPSGVALNGVPCTPVAGP
jgi:mannan endo-1,4-beta-mannosidase